MTAWQRRLRIVLGVFVVVFAAGVYLAIRKPPAPGAPPPIAATDPGAISEVRKGQVFHYERGSLKWDMSYETATEFADGTTRFRKLTAQVSRRGGRDYEVTADEGTSGKGDRAFVLKGNVHIKSSDGAEVRTDEASSENDGTIRARGEVVISRPHMHGTSLGMTYDQQHDIITFLDQVEMTSEGGQGQPPTQIKAGGAVWTRPDRKIRYDRGARIDRGAQTLEAETITAYLTADEQALKMLQLVGNAHITGGGGANGSLRGMRARDMNLTYAAGGERLQRALLSGAASVEVASDDRGGTTRVGGESIDLGLDEDGTTLASLLARGAGPDGRAELQLPADAAAHTPPRSVKAATIQGPAPGARPPAKSAAPAPKPVPRGKASAARASRPPATSSAQPRGITSLRFTDRVEYRETPAAPASPRVARSPQLDLVVQPGFSNVDEALFTRGVRFEQGAALEATARDARYLIKEGQLELTGVDDKGQPPQVVDEQATIQGRRVVLLPDSRNVQAFEAVQAVFKPAQKRADGTAARTPGLFAQDQPAYATSDALDYDGSASRARFRSASRAKLWQGETTIYGQEIDLDDKTGNLNARGSVVSTMLLEQADSKTRRKEKTKTTVSADRLEYDDASRRAVYTGTVRMSGAQGDVTSDTATLALAKDGNGLQRMDASGHLVMADQGTAATGARLVTGQTLVYTAADEQYVVRGKPVKYRDETYETTGDSLTFWKSVDRILVDGIERTRTQAKSGRK